MNTTIKLVSVNIEENKHLDRIIPFLKKEDADVICIQEAIEANIGLLSVNKYPHYFFAPMRIVSQRPRMPRRGLLVLTKQQPSEQTTTYYFGNADDTPVLSGDQAEDNRAIIYTRIVKDSTIFSIATTHFTWSYRGQITNQQREHLVRVKEILQDKKDLILIGDFNTPRGKEIYSELATMYKDNIPNSVVTTLDPVLHRKPGLQFVVDGLFTSPDYTVENIQIVEGISDHKAIVAMIGKK